MPANASFNEIVTTTIKNRNREFADNVTTHNVLLSRLNSRGKITMEDGGETLVEELDYAENSTFQYYNGYEALSVQASDVLSAAEFPWKQAAVAVTMSGRERRQNMGRERMINLMDARINNAMRTMANNLATGIASDGTGSAGKQVTGLQAAIADSPSSGTYGGIDRSAFSFWQNQVQEWTGTPSAENVQSEMNGLWLSCIRDTDHPDLIPAGLSYFNFYWQSLQSIQRITSPMQGTSGFRTLAFEGPSGMADVFYDSTISTTRMYMLNTNYLTWKVHPQANMTPLDSRESYNQDASVVFVLWQGNLTCSNAARQGVLVNLS